MHVLGISPGQGWEPARWAPVLASGLDGLLIREPDLPTRDLLALARWVRAEAPGLALWVGGRIDVALAAGCGAHLGEAHPPVPSGLLPLSRPIHHPDQALARNGADQLLLSPIHPVPGKNPPWGPARLHTVLDAWPPTSGRLLALGGITPENAAALRHPRLAGVALIRALWQDPDPAAVVTALRSAWSSDGFAR